MGVTFYVKDNFRWKALNQFLKACSFPLGGDGVLKDLIDLMELVLQNGVHWKCAETGETDRGRIHSASEVFENIL